MRSDALNWIDKQRPRDFYGPDDHDGISDPAVDEARIKLAQQRWDHLSSKLTLADRLRLAASRDGILIPEKRFTTMRDLALHLPDPYDAIQRHLIQTMRP